jgi:hypothetical protein
MIKLKDIILELEQLPIKFTNWVRPPLEDLKREFKVEHEKKGLHFFADEEEFLAACKEGSIMTITPSIDSRIEGRSHTKSYAQLLSLIKNYQSYPKYRNEDSLKSIYNGFKTNSPMHLPIVIKGIGGMGMRVFSGNTRLDVASQLGIQPKALVIDARNQPD